MNEIESTGEVVSEEERTRRAVQSLREQLIWIEQNLLLFQKLRAARYVYRAWWELTE
jgi:hypothetical protein